MASAAARGPFTDQHKKLRRGRAQREVRLPGRAATTRSTISAINNGLVNGDFAGSPFFDSGIPVSSALPAKYRPEFGLKLNYTPASLPANFALYYLNYIDKSPVLASLPNGTSQFSYLGNRQLFGASANFAVGDWAIGTELSYRPHDAVALSGCYGAGGPLDMNTNGVTGINCQQWADKKKLQFDINGILALTRSEYPFPQADRRGPGGAHLGGHVDLLPGS
ncbi:DUF1302 family protein [Cupriavidus basilensis]